LPRGDSPTGDRSVAIRDRGACRFSTSADD
jgi:hypothetical protein